VRDGDKITVPLLDSNSPNQPTTQFINFSIQQQLTKNSQGGAIMNTKLFATAAAATTATALLGFAGAAQAFSFGTNGMKFDNDTGVKFEFIQSNGSFQSILSVYEVNEDSSGKYSLGNKVADLFKEMRNVNVGSGAKNGFLSTAEEEGGVVRTINNTVTFLAGKVYTLGLSSVTSKGESRGTVYSMSALNRKGQQRAVFEAPHSEAENGNDGTAVFDPNDSKYASANPFQPPVAPGQTFKPVVIGFEDQVGGGDRDYNDFIITAEAPEPLTIGGLVLGGAGLLAARRRRQGKQA
jgi:hypothetical protein